MRPLVRTTAVRATAVRTTAGRTTAGRTAAVTTAVRTAAVTTAALLTLAGCGSSDTAAPGTTTATAGTSASGTATASDTAAPDPVSVPDVPGLVTYAASASFADTLAALQTALGEAGMVVATLDHAANAASVGEQLRPTTLVIGGNPRAGTPVMAQEQTAGVDLPQKYLVWQAADGSVLLSYNSARYVAARADIDEDDSALDGLATGSARIAAAATGTDAPVSEGTLDDGDDDLADSEDYLLERDSDASVQESIDRYLAAFAERGLQSVATVDHAAGAASIGAELRPTQVTIVGNPAVGTPLLQAAQTFGIDLPIRYLAWQDDDGVHVGHPDIRVLAERHGATGVEDTLAMIEGATDMFDAIAAGDTP